MPVRKMKIANLDEASLERLTKMEEEMGTIILAVEPHYSLADLSDEQLQRLKALEKELGAVLVAFKPG